MVCSFYSCLLFCYGRGTIGKIACDRYRSERERETERQIRGGVKIGRAIPPLTNWCGCWSDRYVGVSSELSLNYKIATSMQQANDKYSNRDGSHGWKRYLSKHYGIVRKHGVKSLTVSKPTVMHFLYALPSLCLGLFRRSRALSSVRKCWSSECLSMLIQEEWDKKWV